MTFRRLTFLCLAFLFANVAALRAQPAPAAAPAPAPVIANGPRPTAFADTAEAGMLHRAYHILAAGDHDYRGHRIQAMRDVRAAADLLGLDLRGDDRSHEKQTLSDQQLREAGGLLQRVLRAAAVNSQPKVARHIRDALKEIRVALTIH